MRLFVAVDLASGVRAALAAEQQRLLTELGGSSSTLRLVRPEQLHLTIVFVGEVSDERAAAIGRELQRDVALAPFEVAFGGAGVFPPRGAPRVLWIGIREGASRLARLHEVVAAMLEPLGVERDPRGYSPHLTIGRWRDPQRRSAKREGDLVRRSATREGDLPSFTVREITLYQSRLSSSGSTHVPLARAQLICPSSPSPPRTS
jgi:2'-5' RNA ligase